MRHRIVIEHAGNTHRRIRRWLDPRTRTIVRIGTVRHHVALVRKRWRS